MAEVGDRFGVDPATASRVVEGLIAKGHYRRVGRTLEFLTLPDGSRFHGFRAIRDGEE